MSTKRLLTQKELDGMSSTLFECPAGDWSNIYNSLEVGRESLQNHLVQAHGEISQCSCCGFSITPMNAMGIFLLLQHIQRRGDDCLQGVWMSIKDDSQLDKLRDLRKTAANLRFALQELYGLLSDGVDTSWFSTDEAQAARDILNATMENDWDE